MTKHDFEMDTLSGKITITSVVMSDEEYDEFCNVIQQTFGSQISPVEIARLREARHIPGIVRGNRTEHLFQQLGVVQSTMSIIVRGEGRRVFKTFSQYLMRPTDGGLFS